jgi:hypothetical protein
MFDVVFYLLHVFLHDRSQRAVRGRKVQSFEVKLIIGERQVTLITLLPML